MTDREKLVEAMARGMFPFWFSDEAKRLHSKDATVPSLQLQCKGYASAALAAIEAMGAVVVPVKATGAMFNSADFTNDLPDVWALMLAASPYAKEPTP